MSDLLNPRHEAFCRAYVRGPCAGNCVASYEVAGYRPDTANASKLFEKPHIQKRIAELMAEDAATDQQALEQHGVDKHAVLAELSKIGFANLFDYIQIRDDELVEIDLTRLNRDQAAAIRDFAFEYADSPNGGPRRLHSARVRMFDKRLALTDLARHLGLFVSQRLNGVAPPDDPVAPLTNAELEDELVEIFAVLAHCEVDLRDMLDRAIAAGRVKISAYAKPLRKHETITDAMARCRKTLRKPLVQ